MGSFTQETKNKILNLENIGLKGLRYKTIQSQLNTYSNV